jgi:hypothetical protein
MQINEIESLTKNSLGCWIDEQWSVQAGEIKESTHKLTNRLLFVT